MAQPPGVVGGRERVDGVGREPAARGRATVTATPSSSSSMSIATGVHRTGSALRVDRVGARLGHREAQVVDAAIGQHAARRRPRWRRRVGRGRGSRCGAGSRGGSSAPRSAPGPGRSGRRTSSTVAARGSARSRPVSSSTLRRLGRVETRRRSPPLAPRALEQPDEHAEAGGVDEVDRLQVEHDAWLTTDDDVRPPRRAGGGGGQVEVAAGVHDRPAVALVDSHHEVHGPNLPGRHGMTAVELHPCHLAADRRTLVARHGRPPRPPRCPHGGGEHRRRARPSWPRSATASTTPMPASSTDLGPSRLAPPGVAPGPTASLRHLGPPAVRRPWPTGCRGPLWSHQAEAIDLARGGPLGGGRHGHRLGQVALLPGADRRGRRRPRSAPAPGSSCSPPRPSPTTSSAR